MITHKNELKTTPLNQKVLNIAICMLLFGFGWHIRGSGTSDPSVAMLMLMLYIGFLFSPKQKLNFLSFGLIVLIFRVMRRGWGTFVSQAGIPGVFPGVLHSPTEGFSVEVAWWQGYFWLFFVGLAWSGLAALIFGGYFFSDKKYNYKDLIIWIFLYAFGYMVGLIIADLLIPLISPEAYYEIYITGISERNFISMRENFAFSFAIIPVFIYILASKKDTYFVKISSLIMIIFGLSFSIADLWQVYGRNIDYSIPFWSLWEYFSGFIIGGLIMILYYMIPKERWDNLDNEFGFFPADTTLKKIILFGIGHVVLFIFGIQESLIGGINQTASALGIDLDLSTIYGIIIILIIDIPLYVLYLKGKIGSKFKKKDFKEKCLLILIPYVMFTYLCYAMQFIVGGTIFSLEISHLVTWLDTISVIIVEIFFIYQYLKLKKKPETL